VKAQKNFIGGRVTVDSTMYNVPSTRYKVWILNLVTQRIGCRQWTANR